MSKTILFASIIIAVMVTGIIASEFVEAAPKNSGTSIQKAINLQPVAGRNLVVNVVDSGTSLLFHGDELCQLLLQNDPRTNTVYIEFATITTVLDQVDCGQPSAGTSGVGTEIIGGEYSEVDLGVNSFAS